MTEEMLIRPVKESATVADEDKQTDVHFGGGPVKSQATLIITESAGALTLKVHGEGEARELIDAFLDLIKDGMREHRGFTFHGE